MVLIDTSVWIRFFANRAPYASEVDRLLELNEVVRHDLVYGELLIGDRGGRAKFLTTYERMHQSAMVPHSDVVELVRRRALHGRGVGWIDVNLLASAMMERQRLWTADPRFRDLADELGVAYRPADSNWSEPF